MRRRGAELTRCVRGAEGHSTGNVAGGGRTARERGVGVLAQAGESGRRGDCEVEERY